MSINIRIDKVLLEYDGPALLTAGDSNGNRYIAYQDLPEFNTGYIVLPVNESKLTQMMLGVLSVRDVVESSPLFPDFFECDFEEKINGATRLLGKISSRQLTPDLLPANDLLLSIPSQSEKLSNTAIERQSTVACLGLYSAEAEERHLIDGVTLSEALRALLKLIKRGFAEFSKGIPKEEQERLRAMNAGNINVLPFQPGSFEVLVESDAKPDLFGFQHTSKIFESITLLLNKSDSIEDSINMVRKFGGHYASAYAQFLEVISVRQVPMIFSWADTNKTGGSSVRIDAPHAAKLLKALRASTELMSETTKVRGVLEKADANKNKWGLRTFDGVHYQGETEGSFFLEGLTIGGEYSFTCREILVEEAGTGKETSKLYAYESFKH